MKKILAKILVLSVLCLGIAGCGGGGGGLGGTSAATTGVVLAAAVFSLAILASGGSAAAVAFAASVKEKPPLGSVSTVSIAENQVNVQVTPMKNGIKSGVPKTVSSKSITVNSDGSIQCKVSLESGPSQYLVEIGANSTAIGGQQTLLKKIVYLTGEVQNGQTVEASVDPLTTAYAMVYESWLKNASTDKTYGYFETKAQSKATTITTFSSSVQKTFSAKAALMSSNTGATATSGTSSPTHTSSSPTSSSPTSTGAGGTVTSSPSAPASGGTGGTDPSAPSDSTLITTADEIANLL